jgi:hypothetical protein
VMGSPEVGVLWVADAQAQDRGPLWSAFAQTYDLTVIWSGTALLRQFATRPRVIILDGGPAPRMVVAALWARAQGIPAIVWRDERRDPAALDDAPRFARGAVRRWYYRSAALVLTSAPWVTEATLRLGVARAHIVEGLSERDIELFIA